MILLAAVRARLGADAVRTGTAFASFAESGSGVEVRVRDRVTGTSPVLRGDVLVGADGLDVPGLITGAPRVLEYPMVDRDPLPSCERDRARLPRHARRPAAADGEHAGA